MGDQHQEPQPIKPDWPGVLVLAGALRQHLAEVESILHTDPAGSESWDQLQERAPRILSPDSRAPYHHEDLAAQGRSFFPPTPETVDPALRRQTGQWQRAASKLNTWRQTRVQADAQLRRIQSRKQQLDQQRRALAARVGQIREMRRRRAEEIHRFEKEYRPRLTSLAANIHQYQAYIDQADRHGADPPGTRPGPGDESRAQKRTRILSIKARLEDLQSRYDRKRIRLKNQDARLGRLTLILTQIDGQRRSLLVQEKQADARLQTIVDEISKLETALNRLAGYGDRLQKARTAWLELKAGLMAWPRACQRLHQDIERESAFVRTDIWKKIDQNQKALDRCRAGVQSLLPELESLGLEISSLVQSFGDLEIRARQISTGSDRGGGTDTAPERPGRPLKEFPPVLRQERQRLLDRRERIAETLTDRLRVLNNLIQEHKQLAARQKSEVRRAIRLIRAKAAQGRLHIRQVERLEYQLARMYAELPTLIGRSRFLERCLLAGALHLIRSRDRLRTTEDQLDRLRRRLSAILTGGDLKPLPVNTRQVLNQLQELQHLSGAETWIAGLPRRLALCVAALDRAGRTRIRKLGRRWAASPGLARIKKRFLTAFSRIRLDLTGRQQAGQDRLTTGIWTAVVRVVRRGHQLWPSLPRKNGFGLTAGRAAARIHQWSLTALRRVKNEPAGRVALQAIGRGLYTLLLAGGIILASPSESSIATGLVGERTRPAELIRSTGQIPEFQNFGLAGPFYHPLVERSFDLGYVSPWDRAKGLEHVRKIITRDIDALARRHGLETDTVCRLIRDRFKPGRQVSLARLLNHTHALDLLKNHYPGIFAEHHRWKSPVDVLTPLYRLTGEADLQASRFWDRLYREYRTLDADPAKCLAMVSHNIRLALDTENISPPPTFRGRLRPIPELEQLDLADFTRIMAPYFQSNIKYFHASFARDFGLQPDRIAEYALRLAVDMYVAGKIFGVPMTVLVAITHQESYFANVLGDQTKSASPFQIHRSTKPLIIQAMRRKGIEVPKVPERLQDNLTLAAYMAAFHLADLIEKTSLPQKMDQPPICDLDRVALGYNGGTAYPKAVYRKKVRLLGYLNRLRAASVFKISPSGT